MAKLQNNRELMKGRRLAVPVETISFAPGVFDTEKYEHEYTLTKEDRLGEALDGLPWDGQTQNEDDGEEAS